MAPWALLSPGVLVRTGHTVLTWGITLVLFLHDTELRQWEEQGELLLPLTFLLLVLGSLLLYLAVSLMDPGYVNTQPQPQEEPKEEQTAMVPPAIPLRRCRYCLVLQPLRARHCRDCRRCVRRYDHHCPWMENCVGERNHPLFVAYLALQLVVLLWGLYLAWSGLRFFQPWGLWLRSSGLLFATFLLLSLFSLVAGLLLASHLYLVASNTTTWEFISSHRIAYLRQRPNNPFDRGLTRNLAHFFCGWPSGPWETLWAEEEEEEGKSQAV
ncbi:PREDICTED: probable palmitoyltransferase ZDHHC12 [Dipodomys ordii]|uniref:Palmitoyltransferase n=1 Tax=Dipodomys ordii TaxID=10020 RepID=A0A1S3FJP9_DIPOR|nr:PREDICTED: probable palmitoyltransferase ZDHHC12 [Dipodomys ordii]XP_042536896.1 palmitoyltransferase ZDHHC12 isoform X1 [Dipodomys spectabilis]